MISKWTRRICNLLQDESGPTAVEYAVMLALIIGICIGAVQAMATSTSGSFDASTQAISNAMGS